MRLLGPLLLVACTGPADTEPESTDVGPVPWSRELPEASETIAPVRGLQARRAVFHLHSPWSHDACDGHGIGEEGAANEPCLQDLREGLCATRYDVAWLTDHPSYAAYQPFEDLFHPRGGDTWVERGGAKVASRITCDDGHVVTWRAGIEDELMPVGLTRQVAGTAEESDVLYNRSDAEAVGLLQDAGAHVLLAHTEGRDPAKLAELQDAGLHAVEVFNLHAMFAPDIREEDLGLDGLAWIQDIAPFTLAEGTAEPDLFFLAVHQEQAPSLQRFDTLLARGPMAATAGTDAHENVLPIPLRDGERGDSYRRMLRWFSTMLLTHGDTVDDYEEALDARRTFVVFEVFGTPDTLDVHLTDADGGTWEVGSDAPLGTLHVTCPRLSASAPRGEAAPEITVTVFKDGAPWQTTCGDFPVTEAGAYRVRVDIVPHHLAEWLGETPERWIATYPWIYSGAIRAGM